MVVVLGADRIELMGYWMRIFLSLAEPAKSLAATMRAWMLEVEDIRNFGTDATIYSSLLLAFRSRYAFEV
jgi:hypothetical protein